MFCRYCGTEMNNLPVCPKCGAPAYEQQPQQNAANAAYQPYNNPINNRPRSDKKNTGLLVALIVSVICGNIVSAILAGMGLLFFDRGNNDFRKGDTVSSDYNFKLAHNLGIGAWILFAVGIVALVVGIVLLFTVFGFAGSYFAENAYYAYNEFQDSMMCIGLIG